jgi:hypothetical protein
MPDRDSSIRRRFCAACVQLERAGASENTARLVSSLVLHLEQHRHARVQQHERVALAAVRGLIDRQLAERATREQGLAAAVS